MPIIPATPTTGRLEVGDTWLLGVEVRDDVTDQLKDATVTAVATLPNLTTTNPAVTKQSVGLYTAPVTLSAAGRWTAVVTVAGTVVGVADFAVDALAVGVLPTATEVQTYLASTGASSFSLTDIGLALAAERAAQAMVCSVPAAYPDDLREALYRRVARNLAARSVPVAQFTSFDGGGTATRVPGRDPEVGRLEAPYRRLVVG